MLKEDLNYITTEHLRDTNQISVRSANCCISAGLSSLYEILLYFENNGSFFKKKIRNAGHRTCKELDELCINIIPKIKIEKQHVITKRMEVLEVINELTEQEQEMLLSLANLITEKENVTKEKERVLSNYCADNLSFAIDFYERNSHLPMFWILEQYIINDISRGMEILTSTFNIIQNKQTLSLDKIAESHNLTRERVRQIRNDVFHKTFEITDEFIEYKKADDLIKYAQLLQNKDDWAYIPELMQETHLVSQIPYNIQYYLIQEQCTFSMEFFLQIVAYIFRDRFTILGGFEINSRGRSLKSTYLILKEFSDIFDFDKAKEEFSNILVDSTSDYLLDIDDYIANSQSWKQFNYDKTDEIKSIIKDILLHEFGLYSEDINGNQIKIPANKEQNPLDVVYAILQTKCEPMHLDDIFVEFKRIMPEHRYTQEDNPDRLRPYLQRHSDITFRKRSSIYLLKEWKHIRSGTIRDVIIEFLLTKDLPQTVETITEYVLQHFPETNQKNIHSTMFSGKHFIRFKNSLFGLVSKEYPAEYEVIEQEEQRKSFEQRLMELEKFIVENEHFPFSSSENKEEESLCRWWDRVVSGKQTINGTQQEEVERIKLNYADFETDKNAYEWNLNYNKFKMFILENRRTPSASGGDKFLYGWLRRAKDDFLNYRLSEEQRRKYIELAKLIS
ncbi:MAG TPA: hypothetical protein VIK55_07130 [Paludibacter sp.]